jgi:DNA-binding MarR family transcriptional regulator
MEHQENPGEALLRAWLQVEAVAEARHWVSGLTFNEAVVCNHLAYQQERDPDHPLHATDLCQRTGLLKSQMNQVLSSLEKQGFLRRERSAQDRRQVELRLTPAGQQAYLDSRGQVQQLLTTLVDQLGAPRADALAQELTQAAQIIQTAQKGIL